jgi:hypothetical protein
MIVSVRRPFALASTLFVVAACSGDDTIHFEDGPAIDAGASGNAGAGGSPTTAGAGGGGTKSAAGTGGGGGASAGEGGVAGAGAGTGGVAGKDASAGSAGAAGNAGAAGTGGNAATAGSAGTGGGGTNAGAAGSAGTGGGGTNAGTAGTGTTTAGAGGDAGPSASAGTGGIGGGGSGEGGSAGAAGGAGTGTGTCGDGLLGPGEECDAGTGGDERCGPTCQVVCRAEEFQHETHCYAEFTKPLSFKDAQAQCVATGGSLAVITSADEQEFLIDQVMQSEGVTSYWIGLTDSTTEGVYEWLDGEPFTFSNWRSGEPNNAGNEDCAEFTWTCPFFGNCTADGWSDRSCSVKSAFVCEYPAAGALP